MSYPIFCKRCELKADSDTGESEKQNVFVEMRHDYYGFATGYFCDNCYENDYPYRRDAYYDESYAGERFEDNY